ncbi:MAG: hypothetical protein JRJ59_00555 [Deltaproteobacteria bacterium]|nr:hypothetical protein [Deltaproteobacteria bacterium]
MRRKSRLKSTLLLIFLFFSSALACYLNLSGHFDPVRAAQEYFRAGQRDLALETIDFGLENRLADEETLANLKGKYSYTTAEKLRDLFWTGAVKGRVENMYSGLGCLASDLLVVGDVRDLSRQVINKMKGDEVDKVVTALAAIGLATTAAQVTGGGVLADAGASLLKNAVKYARRLTRLVPHSLLKAAAAGQSFSRTAYKQMWLLFKQNNLNLPHTAHILARLKDAQDLEPALAVSARLKKGGVLFFEQAGRQGLSAFQRLSRYKAGPFFIDSFKRNPSGVIGLSRFHALVAGAKFVKKEGFLMTAILAVSSVGLGLALLPGWVSWGLFGLTSIWLMVRAVQWLKYDPRPDPDEVEGPMVEFAASQR